MEIEIIEKKESPLLSRIEISFRIKHPKESTPKRNDIRDELSNFINVKKNCIVIDNMKAVFGKAETIGFAKIYSSVNEAQEFERKHILTRNKLDQAESKKSESKTEKKEETAKDADKGSKSKEAEGSGSGSE